MTPFLTAYFARIGWSDSASVDIETLKALHLLHNGAIPFENLDVLLPREMQLDDLSLEEKLVTARRGGYCLNRTEYLSERYAKSVLPYAVCSDVWYWRTRQACHHARIVCCWLSCRESSGSPTLASAGKR